jgi:hypothetical protein
VNEHSPEQSWKLKSELSRIQEVVYPYLTRTTQLPQVTWQFQGRRTYSTRGEGVAAWFLDTDYDGKTFHICQAFFPGDAAAWEKLQRALKAQIAPEAFEQMRGTVSFPFEPGEHRRIAVKVIDFRGNEVVRVVNLQTGGTPYAHS